MLTSGSSQLETRVRFPVPPDIPPSSHLNSTPNSWYVLQIVLPIVLPPEHGTFYRSFYSQNIVLPSIILQIVLPPERSSDHSTTRA